MHFASSTLGGPAIPPRLRGWPGACFRFCLRLPWRVNADMRNGVPCAVNSRRTEIGRAVRLEGRVRLNVTSLVAFAQSDTAGDRRAPHRPSAAAVEGADGPRTHRPSRVWRSPHFRMAIRARAPPERVLRDGRRTASGKGAPHVPGQRGLVVIRVEG